MYRLFNKSFGNTATSHYTQFYRIDILISKFSGRYALCTRQIHYFAILFKIIKLSFPIRSNSKNIYIIFLNIINFLTDIILYNNFIGITGTSHGFNTLQHIISNIQLSPILVK